MKKIYVGHFRNYKPLLAFVHDSTTWYLRAQLLCPLLQFKTLNLFLEVKLLTLALTVLLNNAQETIDKDLIISFIVNISECFIV